jgi:hypothetical protein
VWPKSGDFKLPAIRPRNLFAKEETGKQKVVCRCRKNFQARNARRLKEARGVDEELPAGEKWTEEETTVLYKKSMTWCAEIAGKSRSSEGDGSRQKLWNKYKDFLGKNAFGVTVETAGAEDILAFIRGY